MPIHDNLGIRMKENYENVAKTKLVRRMPVAIRINGKAFHTFTKGFKKPFDEILIKSMQETTKYLCENIQGCVFGYTQSDEITLILIDYEKLETCAWFDYEVQKLCSISASMTTMAFNRFFSNNVQDFGYYCCNKTLGDEVNKEKEKDYSRYQNVYIKKLYSAMFDARCFNIPKEEVTNLIYWRQLDATRNSIQMVAQSQFSHKEIQGLSCNELQNKLLIEKNINWNDYPIVMKRGSTCIKNPNGKWFIDEKMPILKENDRKYIDKLIFIGENMKLNYFLYMNEAEGTGLVNTRAGRIEATIKDFIMMAKAGHNINDDDIQTAILEDHNIENVTPKECEYIAKRVDEILSKK